MDRLRKKTEGYRSEHEEALEQGYESLEKKEPSVEEVLKDFSGMVELYFKEVMNRADESLKVYEVF